MQKHTTNIHTHTERKSSPYWARNCVIRLITSSVVPTVGSGIQFLKWCAKCIHASLKWCAKCIHAPHNKTPLIPIPLHCSNVDCVHFILGKNINVWHSARCLHRIHKQSCGFCVYCHQDECNVKGGARLALRTTLMQCHMAC